MTTKYSVSITSIVCHGTDDMGGDNDEVFIMYQADGGVPFRYPAAGKQNMNTTASNNAVQTWDIPAGDLDLTFEKEVLVTLWDQQHRIDPGSSQYLISYEYTAPGINPGYPASPTSYSMTNHNDANYTINATAVTAVTTESESKLASQVRPLFSTIKSQLAKAERGAGTAAPAKGTPPTASEKELLDAVARAVSSWQASPESKSLFSGLSNLGVEEIQVKLESIFQGPHFAEVSKLVATQRSLGITSFQTVSGSLAITGEIVLGLYGSIGYAGDIGILTGSGGSTATFVIGAIAEELGAGLEGLIEVGLWKESVTSMQGNYSADAFELTDVAGVGYFQFKSSGTTEGYVVGAGIGGDDGVGLLDPAYILVFPKVSIYPVLQATAPNCLILTKLQCLNKLAQGDGHDEAMMVITADAPSGKTTSYRYPEWDYYAMGDDSGDFNIWYTGRSVMFNNTVTIQVNDGGTELASFSFSLTGFSGVNTSLSPTSNKSTSLGQKISYELTALLITKGS